MASHFFPPPGLADTQDLEGYVYDRELEDIPNIILESKVEEVLSKITERKGIRPRKYPRNPFKAPQTFLEEGAD